ncbi:MAG: hypothetical protein P8183_13140 [Anaerolineae bacterium]|jgi:hypothetical protein
MNLNNRGTAKMRNLILFLGILWSLIFVSCQQESVTPDNLPTPTVSDARSEQTSLQTFEDTTALFNGRSLLITHMTQVEHLSVPPADSWKPNGSYIEDEWQVFQFKSGDWSMTLAKLQAETEPSMFRARVTGPSDFSYAADIYATGTVSPAQ